MVKSVIYMHPYDNIKLCVTIADEINAKVFFIHAKNALTDFDTYNIIGFGVGYDSSKKYLQLLKFVEKLPNVENKNAFIFSTIGISSEKRMLKDYAVLLNLLENKGFTIINDFNNKGFNTSSILKCISEVKMANTVCLTSMNDYEIIHSDTVMGSIGHGKDGKVCQKGELLHDLPKGCKL
jgi:hypothetical protein